MDVKVDEFEAIKRVFDEVLPKGAEFLALPKRDQYIIDKASVAMVQIFKRHKADNKRTAARIAEKRAINPNYAR